MALFTNLNTSPYYDDYSHDKKYLKLLFKPGYAVQARELTQIQSSLQNQIQKFALNALFTDKNSSIVNTFITLNLLISKSIKRNIAQFFKKKIGANKDFLINLSIIDFI